jgi:hypothetical protein
VAVVSMTFMVVLIAEDGGAKASVEGEEAPLNVVSLGETAQPPRTHSVRMVAPGYSLSTAAAIVGLATALAQAHSSAVIALSCVLRWAVPLASTIVILDRKIFGSGAPAMRSMHSPMRMGVLA